MHVITSIDNASTSVNLPSSVPNNRYAKKNAPLSHAKSMMNSGKLAPPSKWILP